MKKNLKINGEKLEKRKRRNWDEKWMKRYGKKKEQRRDRKIEKIQYNNTHIMTKEFARKEEKEEQKT